MTDDPETQLPVAPTAPDYEDIILREVSIGFASGVQDLTLYPEDLKEIVEGPCILITFISLQEPGQLPPAFVAFSPEWVSTRTLHHRRKKGTLRPTPVQIMQDYQENRRREAAKRAAGATEE